MQLVFIFGLSDAAEVIKKTTVEFEGQILTAKQPQGRYK